VFGAGCADANVMFVGEAPGREEDKQGLPFVGPAGELLTRMIESIRLSRDEVYIANVIKCRPPNNRDPKPDEIASCEPYLVRQIETIQPSVICTLGRFAAHVLLKTDEPMGQLCGRVGHYQGTKVVPTYHPAALLRNPQWKRRAWEDLKRLRREYDGLDL
jgi:DNA polymerase